MDDPQAARTDPLVLADLVLRPDVTEVSRSRHVIGAVLRRAGCGVDRCDVTELIVCELVANAVAAAASEVRVVVSLRDGTLRVEIHDDGDGEPVVVDPEPLADGGRGLRIVTALAAEWGVLAADGGGKTVWVEQPS
jgi:anti-sigma regulatory factor (Ser/Thr protein kinase)